MADITSANVTYTINSKDHIGRKRLHEVTIAFGNGALTYPTGGVPLTVAGVGFQKGLDALTILESNGKALLYEWDRSANTIRIFFPTQETNSSANRAGSELAGGSDAPAATSLECSVIGW